MEPVVLEEERRVQAPCVLTVAHHGVEVYHPVELSAGADPVVERMASLLVVAAVVTVALEGGDGRSEDLDASAVGFAEAMSMPL